MFEHFTAPLKGFGFQLVEWYDFVDQSHIERLLGVVLAAKIPDFPCFFLPHDACEVAGPEATVETADLWTSLTKACIIRRDGEVADDMEDVSAADGIPCHHGDYWFRHAADFFLHV